MKIDYDNPTNIFLILVTLVAVGIFACMQYKLCIEMPAEWFVGMESGLVAVLCLCVLFHQRE